MDLIEKSENNDAILSAKIRAVCWRDNFAVISVFFEQTTGETLKTGMKVLLQVSCNYHAVYGISLRVESIDPNYTLGDLQKQKEQTIAKLKKDGVFNMQRLLELPTLLKRIAVISSADAAGFGDFVNQIENNQYNLLFQLKLFPALMQGDRAEQSIINALEQIFNEQKSFDAIVIIRGGGAATDLSCFDGYKLAFICAQMPLPVFTGIGHQRDVSVVDMVAYKSLKTPTAVAEYFIAHQYELLQELLQLYQRLLQTANLKTERFKHKLEKLEIMLNLCNKQFVEKRKDKLLLAEKLLIQYSPEKIYKKGYSLVVKDGKIIKSANQVNAGDIITTEFVDGKIISEVK